METVYASIVERRKMTPLNKQLRKHWSMNEIGRNKPSATSV